MKINKYLLTILLGLLLFSFYWFQYRPYKVKKDCFEFINSACLKAKNELDSSCSSDHYNKWIAICLKKNGL